MVLLFCDSKSWWLGSGVAGGLVVRWRATPSLMVEGFFIPGLVSFLLAHIAWHRPVPPGRGLVAPAWRLAGHAGRGRRHDAYLWHGGPPPELRIPVAVYVLVIAPHGGAGLGGPPACWATAARQVALGACIFMLSDSLLATNRFVQPLPLAQVGVLATYYARAGLHRAWHGPCRAPALIANKRRAAGRVRPGRAQTLAVRRKCAAWDTAPGPGRNARVEHLGHQAAVGQRGRVAMAEQAGLRVARSCASIFPGPAPSSGVSRRCAARRLAWSCAGEVVQHAQVVPAGGCRRPPPAPAHAGAARRAQAAAARALGCVFQGIRGGRATA